MYLKEKLVDLENKFSKYGAGSKYPVKSPILGQVFVSENLTNTTEVLGRQAGSDL